MMASIDFFSLSNGRIMKKSNSNSNSKREVLHSDACRLIGESALSFAMQGIEADKKSIANFFGKELSEDLCIDSYRKELLIYTIGLLQEPDEIS